MWLRIVDIDLDASRVDLELAPDQSEEFLAQLDSFVSRCASEGVFDVRLYYRRGTSKPGVSRLEDFAAMKRFVPPNQSPPRNVAGKGVSERFHSERLRSTDPRSRHARARYRIDIKDMESAVDRLHTIIALLCASENLDPRGALQLRLCVYELVSNTVEHGTFGCESPEIRLELLFSDERISVNYRDNADAFLTTTAADVDLVEAKIRTGGKRGLGLYMLNKICNDFEYDRAGDWNVTSFSLTMNRDRETVTKR